MLNEDISEVKTQIELNKKKLAALRNTVNAEIDAEMNKYTNAVAAKKQYFSDCQIFGKNLSPQQRFCKWVVANASGNANPKDYGISEAVKELDSLLRKCKPGDTNVPETDETLDKLSHTEVHAAIRKRVMARLNVTEADLN